MDAGLRNDVIGTKIFFRELLQGMKGSEMFCLDEDLIADLKSGARDQCLLVETWYHFEHWRWSNRVAGEVH